MARVDLKDGVTIGGTLYSTLEMLPLTAGEAIDAAEASEKIQLTENLEPVIVHSPARATAERIRRQIKRLEGTDGEIQGPMQLSDLRKLSEGDYLLVAQMADVIDGLYMQRESSDQGREESTRAG